MDGIRGEVSNKIRSAIKAKLMELGAYVDDELPDYIMVMVANKRSRQQMEEDLQLFLGDSTSTFTAWLHTVLSKLQQVTVNNSELKKGSDKKRPSAEEHKKEKRKKIKKEKDKDKPEKLEKTPEKGKDKEGAGEEGDILMPEAQFLDKPIKSEPVDLIVEETVLVEDSVQRNSHPAGVNPPTTREKKPTEARTNEDEDDDDFINLKADVEADMWGEGDETSSVAAKASNVTETAAVMAVPTVSKSQELTVQGTQLDQSKQTVPSGKPSNTALPEEVSTSVSVSPSKVESKPAPRIIRISETIRQEQETLKPASKVVRDPQALAKRVFQSHIVSLKNAQDKSDKSDKSRRRSSSSHLTDGHPRRTDQRIRKHEHEDLRETLRKERQRERGHGRDRERERRRSRDQTQVEKSQATVPSVPRSPLSHKDENGPNPSLLSEVRVKPRPQMPAALQANRSLILKAVAEAQKSVSKVVIRSERVNIKSRLSKKPVLEKAQVQKQPNMKIQGPSKKGHQNSTQSVRLPSRDALKKMSFTVLGTKGVPSKESFVAEFGDVSEEGSIILDPSLNILIQVPASPAGEEASEPQDPVRTEKVRRWIKDVEEATKSEMTPPEATTELETDGVTDMDPFAEVESASKHGSDGEFDNALEVDTNSLKTSDIHSVVISEDQPVRQSAGTQFVVTLDGLDPRLLRSFALEGDAHGGQADGSARHQVPDSLDGKNMVDEEESIMSEELVKEQLLREELLRQQAAIREQKASRQSTISSPVSASLNLPVKRPASPSSSMEARPAKVISTQAKNSSAERCKFWPSCKNGDKCEFHHPSTPCKLFPNCKFSDRCLYIHPNCRFNTACTRADCPYTHTGPRSAHSAPPSGTNHMISQTIKQACKYFPNCSNLSCAYIHPTVCKFGTHCTRPKCQFIHSDKGLITKHKWVRH